MKICLINILLLLLIFNSYSQVTDNNKNGQQAQVNDSVRENKVTYSFSSGVSVISGSHKGTVSSFFFTPEITYKFSSNLILNSGLIITQNNYSIPVEYIGDNHSIVVRRASEENQNIFYASGNYLLSPKLLISGSITTTLPFKSSIYGDGYMQNSFQSYSMGMSYKFNNSLTISAGMSFIHSNFDILPGTGYLPVTNY